MKSNLSPKSSHNLPEYCQIQCNSEQVGNRWQFENETKNYVFIGWVGGWNKACLKDRVGAVLKYILQPAVRTI